MFRILFILGQVFMLWMLWDAIRRRSEYYWYIIILLPFGEWFYFFTVKIHDPEMKGLKDALTLRGEKPPSLEQLRYRAQESASLVNQLTFAQGLYDHGSYREAETLFKQVLRLDGQQKDAILGVGLCHQERQEYDQSIARFRQLIDLDRASFDYEPWTYLAQAQWNQGKEMDALDTLRQLVEVSPRLRHRLALAQLLERMGHGEECRQTLEAGLEEHSHAPKFLQRKDRGLARQAKAMLKKAN